MASVLIADDNQDLADAWRRALQTDGHEVTVVNDGSAAIEKLTQSPYDVVITDVIMPKSGGIVVSGMARIHLSSASVIAVSGYFNDISGKAKREFLTNIGVKHVLQKPVDINELSRLVDRLTRTQEQSESESETK